MESAKPVRRPWNYHACIGKVVKSDTMRRVCEGVRSVAPISANHKIVYRNDMRRRVENSHSLEAPRIGLRYFGVLLHIFVVGILLN
jgi:hypothetical protein